MAAQPSVSTSAHITRVLVEPGPIIIALATIAGSVFLSPLLAIPGAAAWVITVMAMAGRRARRQREAAIDASGLPPSIQADLRGVNSALDALGRALARVPEEQRVLFASVEAEAREVRAAVMRMAQAAGALHEYLAAHRADDLQGRIEAQRQRLAATTDPVARVPIQAEIARAEERLARRQDMRATLERYRAALRELQGSAEELADRVVNLSAGGVSALYEEFDAEAPIRRIAELRASVAALEEVLGTEQTQEN